MKGLDKGLEGGPESPSVAPLGRDPMVSTSLEGLRLRLGEARTVHVARADRLHRRLHPLGYSVTRKPGTLMAIVERVS